MKKIIVFALTFMLFFSSIGCSDWTEFEAEQFVNDKGFSEQYYANLRRWKSETKTGIAFGWFGFWSGKGTSMKNCLIGLPDSMSLVAIWGAWMPSTLTPEKISDLKQVQTQKGTKVVCTTITGRVGNGIIADIYDYDLKEQLFGWKKEWNTSSTWVSSDPQERALQEESIRSYARALVDSINVCGYDGHDIDNEPTVGGAECRGELSNRENFHIFVSELGKYFGPKSGTDKILVIDGEVTSLNPETTVYFDYFIQQNYGNMSESSLNYRMRSMIAKTKDFMTAEETVNRYISTVNFESYSPTGGGSFRMADGTRCDAMYGHAMWKPVVTDIETGDTISCHKGGFGAYHVEMEYKVSGKEGTYPWTRTALRAVHPPKFN